MSVRLGIMASTKPLITFVMDDEELKRLDDFRFAFRFPSRGAAIRYLINAGLEAETSTPPVPQARKTRPPKVTGNR